MENRTTIVVSMTWARSKVTLATEESRMTHTLARARHVLTGSEALLYDKWYGVVPIVDDVPEQCEYLIARAMKRDAHQWFEIVE